MARFSFDFINPDKTVKIGKTGVWQTFTARSPRLLRFRDGDLYLIDGQTSPARGCEYQWGNGLWLRTRRRSAADDVSSFGVFFDCTNHHDGGPVHILAEFDSLIVEQDPANPTFKNLGWNVPFTCGFVVGAKTSPERETATEEACRTSVQMIYDEDDTNFAVNKRLNAVAATARARTSVALGSLALPGSSQTTSLPYGPSGPIYELGLTMATNGPVGDETHSSLRIQGPLNNPTEMNWHRRYYDRSPAATPLTAITRAGAAIAVAQGEIGLMVRMRRLTVEL